ncbi:conserved hypothetical protein [Ricinus communis]|uniref:Uncharacterized protein n=1 Tax=Ricinus communis TaxID=3988 RepID=B9STE4_RICCO|nr:conserved hypothetical protein [Ricinus communis]
MTLNPLPTKPDLEVKYAIPDERELRKEKQASKISNITGSRKIVFIGDGTKVSFATDMPFKAPGLQWQGNPCMTTRQLEEQRHK